jgi:hypothetical protein
MAGDRVYMMYVIKNQASFCSICRLNGVLWAGKSSMTRCEEQGMWSKYCSTNEIKREGKVGNFSLFPGIFALMNVMVARHLVRLSQLMTSLTLRWLPPHPDIFEWAWPQPILNKPLTAIWSAKMTYIARGLFSVFVADMEMQCTPKHCSYPLRLFSVNSCPKTTHLFW